MLGAYASLIAALVASGLVGQAVFALCGRREWSWLSPVLGLGLLCGLAWATVRLPGEGTTALIALAIAAAAAAAVLRGGWWRYGPAIRSGLPTLLGAVLLVSLPFIVEQRVGILGTSLNPDMSQHLFAADRLASGGFERLISQGYPLGPHSVVVALSATGVSLVHGFGALTMAISICACLAPLELLGRQTIARRTAAALLVGLAYMAASYLIQGAFKETMEALLLLGFTIALAELSAKRLGGFDPAPRWRKLAAVPLAGLAIGATYSYSFPGLLWLFGALGMWGLGEMLFGRRDRRHGLARALIGPRNLRRRVVAAIVPPALIGLAVLLAAIAPELGRMASFASFETFDPNGAGLGNLFNPISPLEALGVWPSGDFRLDAGAGFAPAIAFWAGAALAAVVLGAGVWHCWHTRQLALPGALVAAFALYLYALVAGTPYQEAKAIAIGAPVAMLIAVLAAIEAIPDGSKLRRALRNPRRLLIASASAVFLAASAGCTLLALGNGPVGPATWSPALSEYRTSGTLKGAVVVQAPESYLAQRGQDLIEWELRNNRLCIGSDGARAGIDASLLLSLPGAAPMQDTGSSLREIDGYRLYRLSQPRSTLANPKSCPLFGDDRAGDSG